MVSSGAPGCLGLPHPQALPRGEHARTPRVPRLPGPAAALISLLPPRGWGQAPADATRVETGRLPVGASAPLCLACVVAARGLCLPLVSSGGGSEASPCPPAPPCSALRGRLSLGSVRGCRCHGGPITYCPLAQALLKLTKSVRHRCWVAATLPPAAPQDLGPGVATCTDSGEPRGCPEPPKTGAVSGRTRQVSLLCTKVVSFCFQS